MKSRLSKVSQILPLFFFICTLLTVCAASVQFQNPYGKQQIHGVALNIVVPTPDTTTVFRNPGVGLQSNLITETESLATATPAQNYPIPNILYRDAWSASEGTQGSRSWTQYQDILAKARADLQCANIRIYMHDSGDGIGEPSWVRTGTGLSGWQGSQDDGCGSTCAYSNWEDPDNITAFTATIASFASAVSAYPALCSIDVGWGEYNENNYSGSHYTNASATGISPTPIGGTGNEIPTPNATAKANYVAIYGTAFPNAPPTGPILLGFADDQITFDRGASTLGFGGRQDGWSYRNIVVNPILTPGACSGGGVQMCTLMRKTMMGNYNSLVAPGAATPTPIAAPTVSFPNLWQTKPIVLESWNAMYPNGTATPNPTLGSWYDKTYPYAANFQFATDNHVSQINTKQQFSPTTMEPYFGNMLKTMGYRHVIEDWRHNASVTAGVAFDVNVTWNNLGTSPDYLAHKVLFKFANQAGGTIYKVAASTVANWLPNTSTPVTTSITIPTWAPTGTYNVYVGVGNGTQIIPETYLAITSPSTTDGWYLMSTVSVTSAGTAKPTTDYACGFTSGSTQYLELADSNSMDWVGNNGQVCLRVNLASKAASQGLFTKGDVATAANFEYGLLYWQPTDRFRFAISNGTTVYTVDAGNLGSPSTSTWYTLCGSYDKAGNSIRLKGNNGTANTTATTGSIQNKSQAVRVGNDTAARLATASIDKVVMLKRLYTSGEETAYHNSGDGLRTQDMTFAQKRGTFVSLPCDEATSANRVDDFQNWTFTQSGGVTQNASGVTQLD